MVFQSSSPVYSSEILYCPHWELGWAWLSEEGVPWAETQNQAEPLLARGGQREAASLGTRGRLISTVAV